MLFLNNGLFILLHYVTPSFSRYYLLLLVDNIINNITEKYSAHLFLYIIPENYHLCKKIHGNIFINICGLLSRILCSFFLMIIDITRTDSNIYMKYKEIMFITMTTLSFISLLLFLIFYKDIRVKAISRILKSLTKDDLKISTEV